ncbi:hypothetical protein HOLleu_36449 [Holothuria leucospilota]|uniref:Uncharacterized protein n=1 Tax=Holothuria leucospilota TaxID=206669 RepID=A0A9Q1BGM0_HOLLE|nr:hypothetical protein HOLleu_36449 [Holothuria leucospilota]
MFDMNPVDKTCRILSTLEYMGNLAIKHHVPPVLTFDQPLYWKAAEIIRASPENSRLKEIVLILGTFHTLMNLTGDLSLEDVMKYELNPFPSSLFEDNDILRTADKPKFAQALIAHCNNTPSCESKSDVIPQTERYVLDGGLLLHKLKWKSGDTYGNIAKSYADYTNKRYGSATVVFDGYVTGPSIKDNTHQRRGQTAVHTIVNLTEDT